MGCCKIQLLFLPKNSFYLYNFNIVFLDSVEQQLQEKYMGSYIPIQYKSLQHLAISQKKESATQRRVMRMNKRRAAMKEYFRAATRIAKEIINNCHKTCTLAQVSRPVNPTAKKLSGSGLKMSPHLILNPGRRSFSKSSPLTAPFCFCFCCCFFLPLPLVIPLLLLEFCAKSTNFEGVCLDLRKK